MTVTSLQGKSEEKQRKFEYDCMVMRMMAACNNIVKNTAIEDMEEGTVVVFMSDEYYDKYCAAKQEQYDLGEEDTIAIRKNDFPDAYIWNLFDDFMVVFLSKYGPDLMGYTFGYGSSGNNIISMEIYNSIDEMGKETAVEHFCESVAFKDEAGVDVLLDARTDDIKFVNRRGEKKLGEMVYCKGCGEQFFVDIMGRRKLIEFGKKTIKS